MIKQNAIGTKHEWDTLEREAACVRFLLRTKEVNTGTAVYSKYVLGRYLKELFEIPAFDYWQQYNGVQTAEQCKRDLQLFSLPFEAGVKPAVWLIITVTVLDKIFPLKKKIVIRVDQK